MRRRWLLGGISAWLGPAAARAQGDTSEASWRRLREGGHVLLMRHAQTEPGTGDPPGFRLDECATQRNLDSRGRFQAKAWRVEIERRGIVFTRTLSSPWCRCLETAELITGGRPEVLEALASFFEEREAGAARSRELAQWIGHWPGPDNALLVTHQVNITALTGVFPTSGEAVLLSRTDPEHPLGRLGPPRPA